MNALRTELKKYTKRLCTNMVPPPGPNKRDYSTCQRCHERDATSKRKRKQKGIEASKINQANPAVGTPQLSTEPVSKPDEDGNEIFGDTSANVSINNFTKCIVILTLTKGSSGRA